MNLTASRLDIMFVVYAYARDSPFDLEAFSDSDYARASLDRKFVTGGCQFLGKRLISWQCKKQTIVANSTTEAEYVATANCYEQSRGPIHLVVDETVYKEWEDRLERASTTATSLEAEQDSGNINRTQSMVTLNESFPQRTDSGSGPRFLRQAQHGCYLQKSEGSKGFHQIIDFLTTSHISTLENGDMEITTTIVGKVKVISEASIRRHLKLEDSDGISTLPTSECPIPIT
ncbi:hypothetical protein Tco_1333104 [Tanacetum coccineum]